jgi:hypothetical protein
MRYIYPHALSRPPPKRRAWYRCVLFSLILITVYEFSHAIYPAAYLTIGRAARLATLMGWHDRTAQQLFSHPETLTHREEQRRTWWAMFILDRQANVSWLQ